MNFEIHDAKTAPKSARMELENALSDYEFLPTILGAMADSPELLSGYLALNRAFRCTKLSKVEQNVVLLSIAAETESSYYEAALASFACLSGMAEGIVIAILTGTRVSDGKLESLRQFAVETSRTRGQPSHNALTDFLSAGFERRTALDVILGIGIVMISDHLCRLNPLPVDQAFESSSEQSIGFL